MPNPEWNRDLGYVWPCIINKLNQLNRSRPSVFEAMAYCFTKLSTNV